MSWTTGQRVIFASKSTGWVTLFSLVVSLALELRRADGPGTVVPLAPQIRAFRADPRPQTGLSYLFDTPEVAATKAQRCRLLLDSLGLDKEPLPFYFDRSIELTLSDTAGCGFRYLRKPLPFSITTALAPLVAIAIVVFITTFAISTVLTYPHLGFRRLGVAVGTLLGVGTTLGSLDSGAEALILGVGAGLAGALIVVWGRDVALWILAGFKPAPPGSP